MLGEAVVVEGFEGSATLGDHSEVAGTELMPTVDDLCRSYLDLKYHFDPAAASCGRAWWRTTPGSAASTSETVREHLAALRAIAGAAEELEIEDLQDEIDRTGAARRDAGQHASAGSTSSRTCGIRASGSPTCSRRSTPCWPATTRRAGGRAPAALERLEAVPAFLDDGAAPRSTSRRRSSSTGARHARRRRRAAGPGRRQRSAPRRRRFATELQAAAEQALEALKRFGTALRDEIEPSHDPLAFAIGEEQFSRRLHHEHALVAGAPELWRYGLHLQEETEAELAAARGRARRAPRGASWWTRSGTTPRQPTCS